MAADITVGVAVDKAAFSFDKLFTYRVPNEIGDKVKCGCRVMIPFGTSNRKRQGIVLEISQSDENTRTLKPISALLDENSILTDEQITLVKYLKNTTFCTYYEAVKTILPTALNFDIKLIYSADLSFDDENLDDEERRIYNAVRAQKSGIAGEKLCSMFGITLNSPVLRSLCQKGALKKSEAAKRRKKDDTVTMVRISENLDDESFAGLKKLTRSQKSVIDFLKDVGEASVKEITYFTSCTRAVTDNLRKKGILEYFEVQKKLADIPKVNDSGEDFTLNGEQQAAFDGLLKMYENYDKKKNTALLFGVTGSGKTQVFMRLIERVVADSRQVIVMVPEIALTPQTIERFERHFGDRVAIIHSGLSVGDRYEQYRRIESGKVSIAVGTRSAVFAPFSNIGLIIMDEEQENSYKSDRSPRYHARDVAKFRASRHSAMLVLASATPSMESYYNAVTRKYSLFKLKRRYGDAKMPGVGIIDMKEEQMNGNTSPISGILAQEIAENLKNSEQTILLLNRRGYNTLIRCAECGAVAQCPNCSIAMTYHRANGRLMCHYCGHSESVSPTCKECGSKMVRYDGIGTQKLEQELASMFENASILRMDADTTMSKHAYEKAFNDFNNKKYDILIGTQMVAKGLDFHNVTLVGVLGADATVYSDNFKSAERMFSLITQVIGRSGRGQKRGRAYVQTFSTDNRIIELAAKQDYEAFFNDEINYRRIMLYPPFCDICQVMFFSENENAAKNAAYDFYSVFAKHAAEKYSQLPIRVLGPVSGAVAKINNKYRYKLLIKCRNTVKFRSLMSESIEIFDTQSSYKSVNCAVDMYFDGVI